MQFPLLTALESSKFKIPFISSFAWEQLAKGSLNNWIGFNWLASGLARASPVPAKSTRWVGHSHSRLFSHLFLLLRQSLHTEKFAWDLTERSLRAEGCEQWPLMRLEQRSGQRRRQLRCACNGTFISPEQLDTGSLCVSSRFGAPREPHGDTSVSLTRSDYTLTLGRRGTGTQKFCLSVGSLSRSLCWLLLRVVIQTGTTREGRPTTLLVFENVMDFQWIGASLDNAG